MLILAMSSLIVFLFMLHLIAGRTCRENRSVILALPLETTWEAIRDFGALHAGHGRGRPLAEIASSELVSGDGRSPGSIWRQSGTWDGDRYWSEIEIVECEAPHRLVVALRRDSFGTQNGLTRHRCVLDLAPDGNGGTKLRLRLSARLNSLSLILARTISPERMHSRLLDLSLRSAKIALEGMRIPVAEPAVESAVPVARPAMLPGWIKPEVAAAALYTLRQASAEGALDRS